MGEGREEQRWVEEVVGLHIRIFHPMLRPETFWPLVDLAVATPRVLEALRHFQEQDSWDALYRVYETVQGDVGSQIVKAGWITAAEETSFTHTANANFRHAKDRYQPPEQPMDRHDAADLMRRLLRRWITAKQTG